MSTEFSEETIEKLKEAYTRGFTDQEAAWHAEVELGSLLEYLNENEDFRKTRMHLRSTPDMLAKINLYDSLEAGDDSTSRWHTLNRGRKFINDDDEIDEGFFE